MDHFWMSNFAFLFAYQETYFGALEQCLQGRGLLKQGEIDQLHRGIWSGPASAGEDCYQRWLSLIKDLAGEGETEQPDLSDPKTFAEWMRKKMRGDSEN